MLVNILHLSADQVLSLGPDAIQAEIDRRQSYMEQMALIRAKFKVWDGVIDYPVFKGINRAHKAIVQSAKDNNQPEIIVMESDTQFTHPDSFKYFLKNKPKKFDFYAGVLYYGNLGEDNRLLNGGSAIMSLYIISKSFYDTFLNLTPEDHIDRLIGLIAMEKDIFVCSPHVCTQPGGYSYNHRRKLYYGEYLRDKPLFAG